MNVLFVGLFFTRLKKKKKSKICVGDEECKRKVQTKARLEMTKNRGWGKIKCKEVDLGKITYF